MSVRLSTWGPLKRQLLECCSVPPGYKFTGGQRLLEHSMPSASWQFQLSWNKFDRLSCRTWVTFLGALMLNTAHWCHCWKLSELTVLSRAGPQIYILYSSSLQTFNLALILNPFPVNLPKKHREVTDKKYNFIVIWGTSHYGISIDGNKMGSRKLGLPPGEVQHSLLAQAPHLYRKWTHGHQYLCHKCRN